MLHTKFIGSNLEYVNNGKSVYYRNSKNHKKVNVRQLNGNLSTKSNIIGATPDIHGSDGDNLIVYIKTPNGIRTKIIEYRRFDPQPENKIDDVRVLNNGHWILIHVENEGWFFDSFHNNEFVQIAKKWQKKKNVNTAVEKWGINRREAEKLWNKRNGKYSGGSKAQQVKGKRVLKNGTVAGYVRQRDGSYKWRFLKRS